MKRLVVVLLLIVATSAGCASRQFGRMMRAWNGQAERQLVTEWGPPAFKYADGQGGQVYVYIPASSRRPPAFPRASETRLPVYTAVEASRWRIHRTFFIDMSGRIYRSAWKGKWECCGT